MGNLLISTRNNVMHESPIRKLAPYATAAKNRGIHVYHLNIGQPDIKTPEIMREAYNNPPEIIEYSASEGLLSFRKKLVGYYKSVNVDLDESNIFITTGGSEAIIFALMSALSPGEEVIIPEPFYTNYNSFAVMASVKIKAVPTSIETGFDLPEMSEFEKVLTPKTKAIIICNPGNPTGAVFPRERLQELVDFAKKNNLYIISDEVYREFTYEGRRSTSIMEFQGFEENGIVIDSVSKRYSACGARVGCLVTKNRELLKLVLKLGQARLSSPMIDQLAAEAAIDTPKSYFDEIIKEYTARRNVSFEMLSKIEGVVAAKPQGAFYIIVGLPIEDAEDFAIWMLKDYSLNNETVMVAPANGFYATPGRGKNQIRIAYVLKIDDLKKSFTILEAGLIEYMRMK